MEPRDKKRLSTIYYGIRTRCYNKNVPEYKYYGGRGITVCDEWLNSIHAFMEWALNNGYSDNLELDREINSGNYEPSNCRWVTHKVNCRNKGKIIKINHNGVNTTLADVCEEINIPHWKAYQRLQYGWPLEEAISRNGKNPKTKVMPRLEREKLKVKLQKVLNEHYSFFSVTNRM